MSNSAIQFPQIGTASESQRGLVNGSDLRNLVFGGTALAFRNKIINGNFDIWQRGTTQTTSGYGSSDRWSNEHVGITKTTSRQNFTLGQTDVPGNPSYFQRTVVTNVSGNGNNCKQVQAIESVKTLSGQTATVSFWAKADSAKNIAIEFTQYFGSGGTPSATVTSIGVTTFSLTTSWQKFTTIVNIPSVAGKTIGSDNNDFLGFIFWLNAGSDFNSRTNSLGQQSGTFDIAQVQLEAGSVATPFEHRPIGTELQLCQRYYELFKGIANSFGMLHSAGVSATIAESHIWYRIPKRGIPSSITFPSASDWRICGGSFLTPSNVSFIPGEDGARITLTFSSGVVANQIYTVLWQGSGNYVGIHSEL